MTEITTSAESSQRRRLTEVEERLDRIAARFTFGYGSDSDREGWLLWIRQLEEQRATLRRELGLDPGAGDGPR
jgi:hypothetical protein